MISGGACPSVCGTNGFCCRHGFKDCPKNITKLPQGSHACVQTTCWEECGNKTGYCPGIMIIICAGDFAGNFADIPIFKML